jgi:hypothetical protein
MASELMHDHAGSTGATGFTGTNGGTGATGAFLKFSPLLAHFKDSQNVLYNRNLLAHALYAALGISPLRLSKFCVVL